MNTPKTPVVLGGALEPGRLLTTAEAGKYLRLHPGSLANMRSEKAGPPYVKLGSAIRYRRVDLDQYIESRVVDPYQD